MRKEISSDRFHLRIRWIAGYSAPIVVLCVLLSLSLFGNGVSGKNRSPWIDSSDVKVMTFNIRYANPQDGLNYWDNRREAVIRMLRAEQPDVLGIQEGLVQQVAYLNSALIDYAYVGVGRDDGRTAGEYAAIYYNKARFTPVADGHFWLSETPDTVSMGWDAVCVRIATWVKLREKSTGKECLIFNTHFDHVGVVARRESAKLLLARVQQVGDSIPTVIMGDLNYPVSDPSLAPLVNALTFKEVRKTAVSLPQGDTLPARTFQGFHLEQEDAPQGADYEAQPIDHIFVQAFRSMEYRVITQGYGVPFLSDHYPVVSVLRY